MRNANLVHTKFIYHLHPSPLSPREESCLPACKPFIVVSAAVPLFFFFFECRSIGQEIIHCSVFLPYPYQVARCKCTKRYSKTCVSHQTRIPAASRKAARTLLILMRSSFSLWRPCCRTLLQWFRLWEGDRGLNSSLGKETSHDEVLSSQRARRTDMVSTDFMSSLSAQAPGFSTKPRMIEVIKKALLSICSSIKQHLQRLTPCCCSPQPSLTSTLKTSAGRSRSVDPGVILLSSFLRNLPAFNLWL